jgi:hypothetical protein
MGMRGGLNWVVSDSDSHLKKKSSELRVVKSNVHVNGRGMDIIAVG